MDKEEGKAIDASIEHWEEDIIKYLLEGRVLYQTALGIFWEDDDTEVPCTSKHCPLCNEHLNSMGCVYCPYKRKHGRSCDEGGEAWIVWYREPTLENALAMVAKLKGLLPEKEGENAERSI